MPGLVNKVVDHNNDRADTMSTSTVGLNGVANLMEQEIDYGQPQGTETQAMERELLGKLKKCVTII